MTLPIQTLPITEQWDCTGCGKCCRGNIVPLDEDDLERLRGQRWDQHPDFRGTKTIRRTSRLRGGYQLAQRSDGTCVFLGDDGLCRIHQEYGFESKPLVCRMYPLQLVPLENKALLTIRRSCPTAAADQGSALDDYRQQAKAFVRERPRLAQSVAAPPILPGHRRTWKETEAVLDGFERLLTDERFPLVRRLAHGVRFSSLLESCRLRRLEEGRLRELVEILVENAPNESRAVFQERQAPNRGGAVLFRQVVAEYLRLHPIYLARPPHSSRWRLLTAAFTFARGRGGVPQLHPDFPEAEFAELEARELGHLDVAVQAPLRRYYETLAVSRQYAVASRPGWSLLARFRATALAYPVALWMLRYFCAERAPEAHVAIDLVSSIDRGQGYAALTGRQHQRRVSQLSRLEQLDRLIAWYAR